MIVLGVTGGIGSGKGLAAEFFRSRGAAVIDADEVARTIVEPGSPVLAELVAARLPDGPAGSTAGSRADAAGLSTSPPAGS